MNIAILPFWSFPIGVLLTAVCRLNGTVNAIGKVFLYVGASNELPVYNNK